MNYFFNELLYCERVSKSLNIDFKPDGPYKMCDLKPFLPIIHKEEVKDYEFVGFADIDLIFGDIQGYLEPIIDRIDVFSSHSDRVSGHFFFIRNNNNFRDLAYKINNWENLLSMSYNLGIDEGAFCDVICPINGIQRRIWHRITKICSFSMAWRISQLMNRISQLFISSRFHFKELHSTHSAISPNILKYKFSDTEWIYDGKIIKGKNNGLSYPYLHFLFLKTVKDIPVEPTWKAGFYQVDNPEGRILITGNSISNI